MGKSKLLNRFTNEQIACDKIIFDGHYYYINNEDIKQGDWFLDFCRNGQPLAIRVCSKVEGDKIYNSTDVFHKDKKDVKKIISTSNPYTNLPTIIQKPCRFTEEDLQEFGKFCVVNLSNVTSSPTVQDGFGKLLEHWLEKEAGGKGYEKGKIYIFKP